MSTNDKPAKSHKSPFFSFFNVQGVRSLGNIRTKVGTHVSVSGVQYKGMVKEVVELRVEEGRSNRGGIGVHITKRGVLMSEADFVELVNSGFLKQVADEISRPRPPEAESQPSKE